MLLRNTYARVLAARADKRIEALYAGRFATASVMLDQICNLRLRAECLVRGH